MTWLVVTWCARRGDTAVADEQLISNVVLTCRQNTLQHSYSNFLRMCLLLTPHMRLFQLVQSSMTTCRNIGFSPPLRCLP